MALTAAQAQRKIDAIDKRIDAVRAELVRRVGSFDDMSAAGWQSAWDSYPGLQGMERALFLRRADAQDAHDALAWKAARAAELREQRAFRKQATASRLICAACGSATYAEAA